MRKTLIAIMTAAMIVFSASSFATNRQVQNYISNANYYLGLSNYYKDMAQDYHSYYGRIHYTALYYAYLRANSARWSAYYAYIYAYPNTANEYYAYYAYSRLTTLTNYLLAGYRNGGRYVSQANVARNYAWAADAFISLVLNYTPVEN